MENLARLLRERENKNKIGMGVGEVVEVKINESEEVEEVKIKIGKGNIIINNFISSFLFTKESLNKKVIFCSSEDNQKFFILGYANEYIGNEKRVINVSKNN